MTYVTYKKTQYSDYKYERGIHFATVINGKIQKTIFPEGIVRHSQPPKKIPLMLPKPNFMPNYLVRISDMKVVEGSKVQEGYCTLSYSWNQSGEIKKNETTGDMNRNDQGKHKIIYPGKTVRKKPRGRKRIPGKVKFVTFKGLIQEICKDFNIKYIWYDQMCLDDKDEEQRKREIHQMYKIYKHGYCTIALVPELTTVKHERFPGWMSGQYYINKSTLQEAQWMKRMWTLEETIMSSKMLLVGRSAHCWWYRLSKSSNTIFHSNISYEVANILYYAHTRTSTKKHDHVFALTNIFPDILKDITIDYNQDIQELLLQCYGLLAKKDIGILCFGPHRTYKAICKASFSNSTKNESTREAKYIIPIQKFDLPSWTGAYGEHYRGYKTSFKNYTVTGRALQVTCSGMRNDQHHTEIPNLISIEDIQPPLPQQKPDSDCRWTLVVSIQSSGSTKKKLVGIYRATERPTKLHIITRGEISQILQNLSHFLPIKKESLQWIPKSSQLSVTWFYFHKLVETLQYSAQYVLLTGICFTRSDSRFEARFPIIKKEGDYYKAIGMCRVDGGNHFFNGFTLEEQIFEIY